MDNLLCNNNIDVNFNCNIMTHKFYMPAGLNAEVNEQDVSLEFIRYTSGLAERRHITDDPFVSVSSGIPQLWDGWLFTNILRDSKELVGLLETMQYNKWVQTGIHGKKTLVSKIVQVFRQQYFQVYTVKCVSEIKEFFALWPMYQGILVCFGIGCKRLSIDRDFVVSLDNLVPFTPQEKQRIISAIEKCSPLIADWCMANFSHFRDSWCLARDMQPVDLSEYNIDDNSDYEFTEDEILYDADLAKHVTHNKKPLKRKAVKPRKAKLSEAELLATMNAKQKRNYFISKKFSNAIKNLRRKGKIPEGVRETLYWEE